jgi:hypothetical protein
MLQAVETIVPPAATTTALIASELASSGRVGRIGDLRRRRGVRDAEGVADERVAGQLNCALLVSLRRQITRSEITAEGSR